MGVDAAFINAIEIAAGIVAVLSVNESIRMAEISQDYADLYREKETHYFLQFKENAEIRYINHLWNLPIPTFDFIGQRSRIPYDPLIGPMPSSANIRSAQGAYEYSELIMLQARLHVDIGNYLFAFEKERVRIDNDRRWEYRTNVLNVGLGVATDVRNRMAVSMDFMDNTIGNSADMFATASNELGAIAGFNRRFDMEGPSKQFDAPVVGRINAPVPDVVDKSSLVVTRVP